MQTDTTLSKLGKSALPRPSLRIRPQFDNHVNASFLNAYVSFFEETLNEIIPSICSENEQEFLAWIQEFFPVVKANIPSTAPEICSLLFFCQASKLLKIETLLVQFLQNCLIPNKTTNILSSQHLYFCFEDIPSKGLFGMRVQILIEDVVQLNYIKNNMPRIERELRPALHTPHLMRNFLEAKSLSDDLKTSLIFQDLATRVKRFPYLFDQALFIEFKRFLALSLKEFWESRSSRHLVKILVTHHIKHKNITRLTALFPNERHLTLRITSTRLQFLFGTKSVVGLIIGFCLLDRYESFEEKHILLVVQKIIPHVQSVKGSFYEHQSPYDMVRTIYLEIEKKDGEPISIHEQGMLKRLLPNELKASVEKLIPAVFMMRNEEEIMKNILILGQELKYSSDLPQVMITLEQQSGSDLVFTILLVRLLIKHVPSLDQLFRRLEDPVDFSLDRVQVVGYLRKKYPKEANTFRLRIPKEPSLLRTDSSVNFYLARQRIMHILNKAVGEVRDYNGGMILQQIEQLSQLQEAFPVTSLHHPDLLENFFYALTPIEVQATLPLEQLQTLFRLLLESISEELHKRESCLFKSERRGECIFVLIRAREASYREHIQRSLNDFGVFPKSLCSTHVDIQGSHCTGFIYDCPDLDRQGKFLEIIEQAIASWQRKISSQQILRLSYLYFPISLDPRIGGDEASERLIELLFEGLMRIGSDGKPACALAKSYEISADGRQYTFHLRDSLWTNGDPVTAYDFEYTWKRILSPGFSTPFAYYFYLIKNAKNAKEGSVSLDEVGVRVLDERTLKVELENPAPYFLERVATATLYAPVNHQVDKIHPNWSDQEGKGYVCNGPFQLKKRSITRGYELVKNPLYWDKERVFLDQILVTQNDNYTALQMFKNDETDWLGRPLRAWDPSFTTNLTGKAEYCSTQRIFWYVFNVQRFPFNHVKLRKALAYAVNRKVIIEELQYDVSSATTPLPLGHTQLLGRGINDGDNEYALRLFEESLKELGIKREDFPTITLIQTKGAIADQVAPFIARQWRELFGIRCRADSYEWNTIFDKMTHGDYQIGGLSWKSGISDPINTLNAFRYASEKVNFAQWEDERYQKCLDAADKEVDYVKRLSYLRKAEEVLLREMPIIPIYYEMQQFMRKERLKVAVNPTTGQIDFSTARISAP